jgi:hypothetical protein
MKDMDKTRFCLGLQIEHLPKEILIHQSTYTKKVLERFNMMKAHEKCLCGEGQCTGARGAGCRCECGNDRVERWPHAEKV